MAITEHFVVLNDLPMHWDEDLLLKGVHAVRMHDKPTRLAVVPRRGTEDDVQWFEADPTYVLHWTNAYEDGDEVVLEGFRQGNPSPKPAVDDDMWMFRYLALDWMETRLHRWRLEPPHRRVHRGAHPRRLHRVRDHQRPLHRTPPPLRVGGAGQARLVPVRRPRPPRHRDR